MAVHRKLARLVDELEPDVAVVPECADVATLTARLGQDLPLSAAEWVGRRSVKGLAVLAFGDYRLVRQTAASPALEWILPVRVEGPASFNLLAVWAMNHRASNARINPEVVPQPAAAIKAYAAWVASEPTVLAGDFNHSVVWDRPGSPRNHARSLVACANARLVSAYHVTTGEIQGAETTPTLFWRDRREDGPRYHVDYAFIPESWRAHLRSVQVGGFADWVGAGLSDHVPLVIDVDLLAAEAR
jgi:exodeoxyribonuclease-3